MLHRFRAGIEGMHCAACSSRIERVLSTIDGVQAVTVNLAAETLDAEIDGSILSYEKISDAVKKLGFALVKHESIEPGRLELEISGMHCASCSARIEKMVSAVDGVLSVSVNLATETGQFIYDHSKIGPRTIRKKISALGFSSTLIQKGLSATLKKDQQQRTILLQTRNRLWWKIALAIPLLILSMGEMIGLQLPSGISPNSSPVTFSAVQLFLTLPIMWLGKHFYLNGFPALIRKSPNMDSLIAVGTGAAFLYSLWNVIEISSGSNPQQFVNDLYFESVGVLIALVSLGKYLETKAKHETTGAIRKLIQRMPKTAILLEGKVQKEIDIQEIEEGDLLLVKPGSTVPADGIVVTGESHVDESLMTGESMPVKKNTGDTLYGGTVNYHNSLTMKAQKTGEDTILSQIIRMVQEAQGSKAKIAKLADRVSYYFVPSVMVLACMTGVGWFVLGDAGFSQSLRFFVAVLVIACPCAMGLATPLSIMVGTGIGAEQGILIRNGETLEKLEGVRAVLFDKTGTITFGEPYVVEVKPHGSHTAEELICLIASAELSSEHPLGEAITRYATEKKIPLNQPCSFSAYLGMGIEAKVGSDVVAVGNRKFILQRIKKEEEILEEIPDLAHNQSLQGKTVLYTSINRQYGGVIIIADKVKPEAKQVIADLEASNIAVTMLTGDNRNTAEAIASETGITDVISEVLPDKKGDAVKKYQQKYGVVAMVGDGVNDAPALAQADVGVAMGTGIDIAIESGDLVLVKGELHNLVQAITLSKEVMKNIRQNLFWAFAYNVMGIPIAAGGLYLFGGPALNPMFAGGAMALSSVSVVMNAMRLRFTAQSKNA